MRRELLLLACGMSASVGAAPAARSRFVVPVASGSYAVDIDDDNSLTVSCVEDCADGAGPFLKEDVASTPTGVLAPYEDQNLVVTTWATGSANLMIVYQLDGARTRKVFQQPMLGRADIVTTGKEGLVVRLLQHVSDRSQNTVLRSWQWRPLDGRFIPIYRRR